MSAHRGHVTSRASVLVMLLAALLLGGAATAVPAVAAGWQPQYDGGDVWLTGVSFADAANGWVVGQEGIALMTNDGGADWYSAYTGTANDLDEVCFPDVLHGWAVGWHGTCQVTTDGGASWTAQTTGEGNNVTAIDFADADHGWLGSFDYGHLVYTSDGGATWTPQYFDASMFNARAISAVSASTCWVLTGSGVRVTTDAGATWTTSTVTTPADTYVGDLAAVSATSAWAVGTKGLVMRTTDGGVTWGVQHGTTYSGDLKAVDFVDALHGWAADADGYVAATSDGGATWGVQPTGVSTILLDIDMADATHGWACGTSGRIVATSDGGGTPDTTPPTTTVAGPASGWSNGNLTGTASVQLQASDGADGVGVYRVQYKVDGAADWSSGWSPVTVGVGAPTDHSADGPHTITYRTSDKAGNVEADQSYQLNVDTAAPSPKTKAKVSVRHGAKVTIRYFVADPAPCAGSATVTVMVVKRSGRVVYMKTLGSKQVGVWLPYSFRVKLKAGSYKYLVIASDPANNSRESARRAFVVR